MERDVACSYLKKEKKKDDEFDKIKESYDMTFLAYTSFRDTGYACEIS